MLLPITSSCTSRVFDPIVMCLSLGLVQIVSGRCQLTNTATEEHLSEPAEFLGLVCSGCVLAVRVSAVLTGNLSVRYLFYIMNS